MYTRNKQQTAISDMPSTSSSLNGAAKFNDSIPYHNHQHHGDLSEMADAVTEQFESAVRLVHGLPKEGE